ncbi:MAG: GlsB/YeaQ/YmgE family stress response membrane protein [Chloroflexota bacterium]|nr:GlsB/YeaQ/YmgE family stress response membrane protein [Chloroflexota bacterium]
MDIGAIIGDIFAAPFVCIGWLIVGAIAGIVANNLMKSNQPLIIDIITGLIGAVVGGFLLSLFGIYRSEGGLGGVIISLIVAIIGAVVVIAIWRAINGRRVAR